MTALSKNFPSGDLEQDWKEISMAAHKGDQFVIELLSYSGYNIGKGISILIHLINPESVIISGRGALAGKVWLAPIQQAINEHCIPRLAVNTTITVSTLSHQALLTGSAALVIENSVKETARIIHGLKSKSHIQGEIN
jgi:predicted NBD/HSP70 family sugar kinase